jgi:uncharacterized protein (DUF1501 family)
MTIDLERRRLLQAGVGLAALGAVPGLSVLRSANAATGPGTALVSIHLSGGIDTVNTVIPYSSPAYYTVRGPLAIPRGTALALDDRNALHPALTTLKNQWDQKRLAIVHGVGYPAFDYSHFQAMEIFWSGDPKRATFTGWLGRGLDALTAAQPAPSVLSGFSVGSGLPPSLIARRFTAPQLPANADWFDFYAWDDRQRAALKAVLSQAPSGSNLFYDAYLRNSLSAINAHATVRSAGERTTSVAYPDTYFASGLRFAAQLLREDASARVITMEQGQYDTHENQLPRHAASLAELNAGLGAFIADLDLHGIADRVLILLWSEFARRVEPNASLGTDHGAAQAMFLIGPGVRSGILGTPPSLAPADLVEDGNLPMQFDFRRLYATLLAGWLGVNAAPVVGSGFEPLPVLL